MKILFHHSWQSVPGGVKPTYLAQHGHEVINPKLPDEDLNEAVKIAQAEFDKHQPQVVVGSLRGGAVAMNISSGEAKLVLRPVRGGRPSFFSVLFPFFASIDGPTSAGTIRVSSIGPVRLTCIAFLNSESHMSRPMSGLFILLIAGLAFAQEPTDRPGWIKQIDAVLEAEKDQDALALIDKAAKALPEDATFTNPGKLFERHGEKRIKDKGYEAGFAVAERALKVLPANQQVGILAWRVSLYRFWSQDLLDKNDLDGSLKVLTRGYALFPTEAHIQAGVGYHTQEALKAAEAKSVDAVIEQFQTLSKQFPKVDDIPRRGQRLAAVAVNKLVEKKKFKEAVAAVDRYAPLLATAENRAQVGGLAYDGWALHLASKKEWEAALDKYTEGLKAYPGHARLRNNAVAVVEEWAQPALKRKNWDEAIRIYGVGLKYFPDSQYLKDRKERVEKTKAEK